MTERRIEYVSLAKLKPAKRNPKEHSPDIEKSLGRFGYAEPILLDERTGRLVAGHGRLKFLRKLKAEDGKVPDGVKVESEDWLIPVVRGWGSKSDKEADAYLLASNQLPSAGGWDEDELKKLMQTADIDLKGIGFSDKDLKRILGEGTSPAEVFSPESSFQIVVTCKNEKQQVELLERLTGEGLEVRALVA